MSDHLTSFTMMRVLVGEIEETLAMREHRASCDDCRTRFEAQERVQALGRSAAPPLLLSQPPRRRWAWAGAGIAAAAAVLVLFALPQDGVRAKGDAALTVFCRSPGGTATPCASGSIVTPKTALMFRVRLEGARHLMLLGRDGSETIATYFPEGTKSRLVEPDQPEFMSASVVLDDTKGPERFVVFVARRPFERREVEPSMVDPSAPIEGIQALTVTFEKAVSQDSEPDR